MALFRALTIQSGVTTQIQTGNFLAVGNGIDPDVSGSLTIGPALATSVVLGGTTTTAVSVNGSATFDTGTGAVGLNGNTTVAASKNLSAATGSGAFDFHLATGTFQTSTGANSLNGNTTVTSANTFTVGTGTTTLGGALTQSNGTVSLTANGASSFTTSAGALTLTSNQAATWSTTNGALTVDAATALDLGTSNATSVSVSRAGQTTTVNGALTVTQATTLNSSLTQSGGAFSLTGNANSTITSTGATHTVTVDSADVLNLGTSTATAVSLGRTGVTTTNNGLLVVTGTTTLNGNTTVNSASTVLASTAVTATGTTSMDLSGGSGTFKTTTGAVTIGPGVTTVSGVTTFSAAGTALTVTNNAQVTGTLKTNSLEQITASTDVLVIGSTGTAVGTTVQIGKAGHTTEIMGDLKVDGVETIVGISTFQSAATFDGNVVVADGYSFTMGVDETTNTAAFTVYAGAASVLETEAGTLTLDGFAGTNINKNDATYIDVGITSNNTITVASGITLQATGTGQIIATSTTGTADVTVGGINTTAASVGSAVYVSANNVVTKTDNAAIATSYCIGFAKDSTASGNVYTDGIVTPIITGGTATAGQVMYLDTAGNAGKVTATAPSAGVVAPVGFMLNTTQLIIRILTPVQL